MQTGVYYRQFTVEFSKIKNLIAYIAKNVKKNKPEFKEINEMAKELEHGLLFRGELLDYFNRAIYYLALTSKDCPREVLEFMIGRHVSSVEDISDKIFQRTLRRKIWLLRRMEKPKFIKSRIFKDVNDVISIETEEFLTKNLISFEITSIKEEGSSRFSNFLKRIPYVGETVKEIRERKTNSSRYTFRPYPLAVRLWLSDAVEVPKDLRDFLQGSIRYHSEEEWRTAIVLAAIAVESVLADLYEELFREYAPNVPLGVLYEKIKGKIEFPSHICGAIEIVNEARISAVHRSRFPVSDREAINALYGATTFIMWYSSDFK